MSKSTDTARADIGLAAQLNSAVAQLLNFDADEIRGYLLGSGFRMGRASRTKLTNACYVAVTRLLRACFSVARANGFSAYDTEDRIDALEEAVFDEQRAADDVLAAPRFKPRESLNCRVLESQFSHLRQQSEQSLSPPSILRKMQQAFAQRASRTLSNAADGGSGGGAQQRRSLGLFTKWYSGCFGVLHARDRVLSLLWANGTATNKPHWDGETRELTFEGKVLRKFKRNPAERQTDLLEAFEKAAWSQAIDNPFPSAKKLNDTVRALNGNMPPNTIKFSQNAGDTVEWCAVSLPTDQPR
jgi:hypothetical protein